MQKDSPHVRPWRAHPDAALGTTLHKRACTGHRGRSDVSRHHTDEQEFWAFHMQEDHNRTSKHLGAVQRSSHGERHLRTQGRAIFFLFLETENARDPERSQKPARAACHE